MPLNPVIKQINSLHNIWSLEQLHAYDVFQMRLGCQKSVWNFDSSSLAKHKKDSIGN